MAYPTYYRSKQLNYAACVVDEFTAIVVNYNANSALVRKLRPYNNSDVKAIIDTHQPCSQIEFMEVYELVQERNKEIIHLALHPQK